MERRSATSTIGLYNKTFEVSDLKNVELKIREEDWAIILIDLNTIIEEVPIMKKMRTKKMIGLKMKKNNLKTK